MTAFDSLVRISRWHLDEKRQKLADLERLAERLRDDLCRLDEGLVAEQAVADRDEEARQALPGFMQAEQARRKRLQASIADVEQEIEAARDEVAEAFREVKTYELAKENEDTRQRQRRARAEQQRLDELGLQRHTRSDSLTS